MELVLFTGDLPSQPLQWVIVDEGRMADAGQSASLSAFSAQYFDAATLPLSIVLPGERIASRKLSIPARNEAQLRQAASLALEDELAEPIDKMHVAVSSGADGATKEIIALPEEWLKLWAEALREFGLTAHTVTSDFLLLRGAQAEGCVLFDAGRVVGNLDGIGFAVEQDFAATLLPAMIEQSGCRSVTVYNHGQTVNLGETAIIPLANRGEVLSTYIEGLSAGRVINLLQGNYKQRTDWSAYIKPWRQVAAMVAVCGIAWGLSMFVEGVRYNNASKALNAEAVAAFKSVYPDERIRNLQAQARSKLNSDAGVSDAFLKLTSMLSSTANSHEGVEVYGLTYNSNGELVADIRFDFASLERLKSDLNNKGVQTQEGRSPRLLEGNVYIGKLTLRIV